MTKPRSDPATVPAMRFAYADPPYPGCSRLYRADPQCAEVDHAELIQRLCDEFSDGWALSTSSSALKRVLALCPDDVRVASWLKPFTPFKVNVGVAYAWEPVILRGGRRRSRQQMTARDWLICNAPQLWRTGLIGAKPAEFCYWLFDMLSVQPGDELCDMYPGTGIVGRCFAEYTGQRTICNMPLFAAGQSCTVSTK